MLAAILRRSTTNTSVVVDRMFYTRTGQIIVSSLFGVALALMFQKTCTGRKCVILTAPPDSELKDPRHHINKNECYRFTPRYIECEAEAESDPDPESDRDTLSRRTWCASCIQHEAILMFVRVDYFACVFERGLTNDNFPMRCCQVDIQESESERDDKCGEMKYEGLHTHRV